MAQITIKDIARICGVGVSTVSRAMNNHPDINPATKEKINKVIEEYGYIPNDSARNLKRSESNTIALLIKGFRNPFFLGMLPVIEDICRKRNYEFITVRVNEDDNEVKIAYNTATEKKLKGIVFLGASYMTTESELAKVPVPMVFCTLGNIINVDKKKYSSVSIDDYAESKKVVEYLVNSGHKRIAILGGKENDKSIGSFRLEAYKDVLKANDIEIDTKLIQHMNQEYEPYSVQNGYVMMKKLIDKKVDCTAVFALSDSMAVGAIRAIYDAGMSVPEDYAVAGFDGSTLSEFYNPTITTIKQPGEQIMVESANLLFDIIEGKSENKHIIMDAELLLRESTGVVSKKQS